MSDLTANQLCVAIRQSTLIQAYALVVKNILVEFDLDHPRVIAPGFEIKSVSVRLKASLKDAPRGRLGAQPLVFEPAAGKIHLHELDLKWEKIDIAMSLQLHEKVLTVFGKTFRFFRGNPQLPFTVALGRLVRRSEVDVHLAPEIRHVPPIRKDGRPVPETEGWEIGFREAMVEFDVFDLEATFEEVVVGALRHALADALAGHSTFVDILAGVHMANPVFQVENHELPFNQRWAKARQLAMDDLRALIDDADRLAEILDLPDDLVKWVYDRVHRNLDLVSWLSEVLAHFFNEKLVYPLPATLAIPANSLKTTNPKLRLLPIQVTIRNPRLTIAPDEVVITLEPGTIEELRE